MAAILLFAAPVLAQSNYPLEATLEIRDSQGRLVSATTKVCPEEGLSVRSTGWQGNSSARARFFSDPIELGTYPVNSAGVLDFTFRVSVENGVHTLRIDGIGANGQPRFVEASILCECAAVALPSSPLAVAGSSLDAAGRGGTGSGGSSLAFGKTGADALWLAAIALDLVAIGLTLRLAAQRRRRTAGLAGR